MLRIIDLSEINNIPVTLYMSYKYSKFRSI